MGLILIPSEVRQKTDMLKSSLTNITENYRKALQVVLNFSNGEELNTETYDKLKLMILDYHQPIVQGMIALEDNIMEDAEVLEQSVGSEELDEDLLNETIKKLQNEKLRIKDQISRYQRLRSNSLIGLAASQRISGEITRLRIEIEKIQQVMEVVKKKLDTLIEISNSTERLFDSALLTLSAVKAAICDAGVEITGVGTKTELDWKGQLTNDIAEMDEKLRLFIEETLAAELQIDLNEIEEKYGNCVVDCLIKIIQENGISRLDSTASKNFIESAAFVMTGYQVTKVNGKYQYKGKDFTKEIMMKGFELYRYQYNSEETAQWYVANIETYCHMTVADIEANGGPSTRNGRKGYECNLPGNLNGLTVVDDCSGFLWATLVQSGYFVSSTSQYTSSAYLPGGAAESKMVEAGFTWYPMSELTGEDLKKGDILVRNGHVEIFYGYNEFDQELALSWGNIYNKLPVIKKVSKSNINKHYKGIWRIDVWEETE